MNHVCFQTLIHVTKPNYFLLSSVLHYTLSLTMHLWLDFHHVLVGGSYFTQYVCYYVISKESLSF